jgi:hypothetical protein
LLDGSIVFRPARPVVRAGDARCVKWATRRGMQANLRPTRQSWWIGAYLATA